jgi:hypothetical protein
MKFIFPTLIVMALTACGTLVSFAPWEMRRDLSAPMLFDGSRGLAFWRCALIRNVSGGPCQLGFKNQYNEIVTLEEIEAEVDAYVPKLGISGPHQFFVLTYSPTVIMFVPGRSRFGNLCSGENYRAGCFSTSKIPNTNFQYGPRPEVSSASYVFVPAINSGPVYIPDGSKIFDFALPDSTLRLSVDGSHWNVLRFRQK